MSQKELKVKLLTEEDFKPFGSVVDVQTVKPTVSSDIFDFWDMIFELEMEDAEAGFLVCRRRAFELDKLERHVKITEMYIPLEGCSIFTVAPPQGLEDQRSSSLMDKATAFVLDGTKAIVMYKGTWHWAPFPLTEKATFVIILSKGTVKEDREIKELNSILKLNL